MTALLDLCRMTRICHMTSLFLIVMTCIAYMRPVYSVDPRQVDGKSLFQSLKPTKCSVSCVSTKVKPVCGTNGITYPSRCDLKRAKKCDGQRVRMKHWGECESETVIPNKKCLSERRKSTKARRKNPKVFVPTCKRDGTYNEIQCHATSRYCWCVNEDGKHRRGTSVIGGRPRCKGKRGGKPKRKRGCTPKDRHNFNTALIKVFEEEYLRVHPTRPPDTAENADKYGTEETIVLWKFAELDLNKDGILKFKEVRNFGRIVKKLIQPRACAKRFVRYCDKVKDRKIEKSEWTLCLGVDAKPEQKEVGAQSANKGPISLDRIAEEILAGKSNLLSKKFGGLSASDSSRAHVSSGKTDFRNASRAMTCFEEKDAALANHSQAPDAKHYIPSCTANGLWEKAQCHEDKGYCWCVAEKTGIPIPGTATFRVAPNCNFENDREMKGCPFQMKRRFLVDLMGDLTEERKVALRAKNNESSIGPEDNLSLRETVARWKLKTLDANGNGILERKEWRPIRRTTLKNRNYPRKCRRNFLRYCDEDDNKRITYEEWKACLGLNENNFNSLPLNPQRTGKNPFVDQLT